MIPIILRPNKPNTIFALGKVDNKNSIIEHLYKRTGKHIDLKTFDNNIKYNFDNDNILYFEKCKDTYISSKKQTEKTTSFAIYTGFKTSTNIPLYAQYSLKGEDWKGIQIVTIEDILNAPRYYDIGSLRFNTYNDANIFINKLHKILMPGEIWNYDTTVLNDGHRKTDYSILESYLKIITTVLTTEWNDSSSLNYKKVIFSKPNESGKIFALLNTGLLTDVVDDIYIYGMISSQTHIPNGRFRIYNPQILTTGMSELDKLKFPANATLQARMVEFFKDISDVLFDTNKVIDKYSINELKHCIEDGIKRDRFPNNLKLEWEKGNYKYVATMFNAAIQNAVQIAKRNYKYVVPHYRPPKGLEKKGKLQFLMPLYLNSNYHGLPDFALVLDKCYFTDQSTFFYAPKTVLELPWAYNNARAICKPDNTWLDPEKFKLHYTNIKIWND